ncbi:MAG: CPBP family intramembrane glutamic endopeptidase [Planctomycetota bacterium]
MLNQPHNPILFTLGAAEPLELTWPIAAGWASAALVVLVILKWSGQFRGGTLRRGPLREVDFSGVDLVIGFVLVSSIFLDKLLVGIGGRFVELPESVVSGAQQIAGLSLLAGSLFFFAKAWLTDAGLRKSGLVPRRPGRDLLATLGGTPAAVLLTFATLVVVNYLATAAGHPSPEVNHGMLRQLEEADRATVITIIVTAVGIGPLLEEIVFRGLLQTMLLEVLGRKARWTTVVIASAAFASVHLGATTWHALPGLFVLGVVLGWIYERTGSLLPVVLIHAAFNALNIAMVLYGWAD